MHFRMPPLQAKIFMPKLHKSQNNNLLKKWRQNTIPKQGHNMARSFYRLKKIEAEHSNAPLEEGLSLFFSNFDGMQRFPV